MLEPKDFEEFQILTGWLDGDAVRKLLEPYGIENDWDVEEDGGIETGWLPELNAFVQANPDYHIITYCEEDLNVAVYDNSVRYVNRLKYYLGNGSKDDIVYVDDYSADAQEDCDHGDVDMDERVCLNCGMDMTEHLAGAAEAALEGDR